MATGESSAVATAAKLEEVLKAVRDVETKVDSKLSKMKREMEAADDRLVKKMRLDSKPTFKERGHEKQYLFNEQLRDKVDAATAALQSTPPAVEKAVTLLQEGQMTTRFGGIGFNSEVLSAANLVYQHVYERLNEQPPHAQDAEIRDLEAALQRYFSKVEGDTSYNKSFAPERSGCQAKWFVDGEDYMSAVADAIIGAKNEVLITDWQLTPSIFLKRSQAGVQSFEWQLKEILLKKAEEGVDVYILLYAGAHILCFGFDLGSGLVQQELKHEKIKVVTDCSWNRFWSHHEKTVIVDRSIAFVGGIDLCLGRWDTHTHTLTDNYPLYPGLKQRKETSANNNCVYRRWVGIDYYNTFVGGGVTEDQMADPLVDYIDRYNSPRMPWHDIACCFTGPAVQDVIKHFAQRWEKATGNSLPNNKEVATETNNDYISNPIAKNVSIQVIRSVDYWSSGQPLEKSILDTYIGAIKNAEHFIYIENQFLISSQPKWIENQIITVLADRIYRAYKEKQVFRVIIVIPLKPEFSGDWGSTVLDAVTYWNYATICRGEYSLYGRLKDNCKVPEEAISNYLSIHGLRNHGLLSGKLVTEVIYVHGKMMIVDDRLTILGSANINDRSMLGSRDSEVAVLIKDTEMVDSEMNGQPYKVGKFSHSLRCHLFMEHLGLLNDKDGLTRVKDPIIKAVYIDLWKTTAKVNTKIFETVFGGKIDPTDKATDFDGLKKWREEGGLAENDIAKAKKELRGICGHLVDLPLHFLVEANLYSWPAYLLDIVLPAPFCQSVFNPSTSHCTLLGVSAPYNR